MERIAGYAVASTLAFVAGCAGLPERVFAPGPETPGLRQRFAGHIVTQPANDPDHIIAISLSDLTRTVVYERPPWTRDQFPYIFAVTGPDDRGRIAFIEGEMHARRQRLKTINLDGTDERVVFDRPGDPMWEHAIGKHPALAPAGGRVAVVSPMFAAQMPDALLYEGPLELFDVRDGSARALAPMALDATVSWFPDAQRLAYVALVPTDRLPAPPAAHDGFVATMHGWDRQPAVCVLDLRTGSASIVHAGWDVVVADDGQSLFITDGPQHATHGRRVWLANGAVEPVAGPDQRVIALKADGTALFVAPPTGGSAATYTQSYSPLAGPRQLAALKVGVLNTTQFETVMPEFDSRNSVSFGTERAQDASGSTSRP